MPRPKKLGTTKQIALRLNEQVLDRADALIPYLSERTGGVSSQAEVLREACMRGLRELEREQDKLARE